MTNPSSHQAQAEPTASQAERRLAVVGSGPNGLTAAALLARAGWQVEVYERNDWLGGAAASRPVFGEGTIVDLGAAAHPLGAASPVFAHLGLEKHGLTWQHSPYPLAHPLPDGRDAAILYRSLEDTAEQFGVDATAWKMVHKSVTDNIDKNLQNILGPLLRFPAHPVRLAQFGLFGSAPSTLFTRTAFREQPARALFTGSAAHAITPLGHPFTSAYGVMFGALGMSRGWPVARGGSQAIVDALVSVIRSHGGVLRTGVEVTDLDDLGPADAILLNLTPAQILTLDGSALRGVRDSVRSRFQRWRYGSGVYKVDYLLDGPIPWRDARVGQATTVHVGGYAAEIRLAEAQIEAGRMSDRPFVMVSQQQAADPTRATGPADGQHVVWTYAHVPAGYDEPSEGFVAARIEEQISRFAPDFRDRILARTMQSPAQLQQWNPNIVGGDIAGGSMTGSQSVLRPGLTVEPYKLGDSGVFIASSATPPGAGVHGMPGYWAAQAIKRSRRR